MLFSPNEFAVVYRRQIKMLDKFKSILISLLSHSWKAFTFLGCKKVNKTSRPQKRHHSNSHN